jgi:hypothetical protein
MRRHTFTDFARYTGVTDSSSERAVDEPGLLGKTKDGIRIFATKYPEATELLSSAAAFSVEAGDRDFAKVLFGQLEKRYQPGAGDSPEHFVESYQRATAKL